MPEAPIPVRPRGWKSECLVLIFRKLWPLAVAGSFGCSDNAGMATHPVGRLRLVPVLPANAKLIAAARTIDGARVVVRRGDTAILDTTAVFAADQSSLSLTLTVALESRVERLTVSVGLLSGAVPLFAGSADVDVFADGAGPPATPTIPLQYVGPGANLVALAIAPRDSTFSLGAVFAFRIAALDAGGAPVPDFFVTWTVSNPQARVRPDGTVEGLAARGQTYVRAQAPNGVADSVLAFYSPPPTAIVLAAGDGQVGQVATALGAPLVAIVRAGDGLGVPGVPVHFRVAAGSATLRDTLVVSDAQGQVATALTLGSLAGSVQIQASAGQLTPLVFTATAVAGPATTLVIAGGQGQTATVGQALGAPLSVTVTDQFGNAVAGARVSFQVTAGVATLSDTVGVSDNAGQVSATVTLGTTAGLVQVRASSGQLTPLVFTAQALAGSVASIGPAAGLGQIAQSLRPIGVAFAVVVKDQFGNGVAGANVSWTIGAGGGSLGASSSATNASGVATMSYTMGPYRLVNQVTASVASGAGPPLGYSFAAVGVAGPLAALVPILVEPIDSDGIADLVFQVQDAAGNPVRGATVGWTVTAGSGELFVSAPTSDLNGLVFCQYAGGGGTVSVAAGAVQAKATLQSAVPEFTFSTGTSSAIAGQAATPPLSFNMLPVSVGIPLQQSISWTITSGIGTLATAATTTDGNGNTSNGFTAGTVAGVATVLARNPASNAQTYFAIPINPTAANRLITFDGDGQSGPVGAQLPRQLAVVVVDQFQNPVPGMVVSWAATSGNLTVSSSSTDALGIARVAFTPTVAGPATITASMATVGQAVFRVRGN